MLLLIIAASLAFSFVLYSGPQSNYDDTVYMNFAFRILHGTFNPTVSPFAYGYIIPASVAASFALFGTGLIQAIIPEVLEFVLLLAVVFFIAKTYSSNSESLMAALMFGISPFVMGYVTRVLPDMLIALLAAVSILFFLRGSKDSKTWMFLAAGFFAGATIFVKFEALMYLLFFIIASFLFLAFSKRILKKARRKSKCFVHSKKLVYAAVLVVGILISVVLYFAPFMLISGHALYPITMLDDYGNYLTISDLSMNIGTLISMSTPSFNVYANAIYYDFFIGSIIYFAIMGTAIALAKRDLTRLFESVLCWGIYLSMFFFTASLSKYEVFAVTSRFIILIAAPMALLSAYAIMQIYGYLKKLKSSRFSIVITVIIVIAVSLLNIPSYIIIGNGNHMNLQSNEVYYSMVANSVSTGNKNLLVSSNTWIAQNLATKFLKIIGAAHGISVYQYNQSTCNMPGSAILVMNNPSDPTENISAYDGCNAPKLLKYIPNNTIPSKIYEEN
jgi:hypothetical protein